MTGLSDFVIDMTRALVAWPTAVMVALICVTILLGIRWSR